jgi:type VI protein secretion system component VasK
MENSHDDDRLVSDALHPIIYLVIVGLAFWFVLSTWALFGSDPYGDWLDVVVTGLFVMAVALPYVLWRVWWRHDQRHLPHVRKRFREWTSGDLQTWQCRLRASEASLQVLLPIAAVAFGMTAIGLVYFLTGHPGA